MEYYYILALIFFLFPNGVIRLKESIVETNVIHSELFCQCYFYKAKPVCSEKRLRGTQ